jgi:hypothetical protein
MEALEQVERWLPILTQGLDYAVRCAARNVQLLYDVGHQVTFHFVALFLIS